MFLLKGPVHKLHLRFSALYHICNFDKYGIFQIVVFVQSVHNVKYSEIFLFSPFMLKVNLITLSFVEESLHLMNKMINLVKLSL